MGPLHVQPGAAEPLQRCENGWNLAAGGVESGEVLYPEAHAWLAGELWGAFPSHC